MITLVAFFPKLEKWKFLFFFGHFFFDEKAFLLLSSFFGRSPLFLPPRCGIAREWINTQRSDIEHN